MTTNEAKAAAHEAAAKAFRAWEDGGCASDDAMNAAHEASSAAMAIDPEWEDAMTERQEQAMSEGEEAYGHELRAKQLRRR